MSYLIKESKIPSKLLESFAPRVMPIEILQMLLLSKKKGDTRIIITGYNFDSVSKN